MIIKKTLVPRRDLENFVTKKSLRIRKAFYELAKSEEKLLSHIEYPDFLDPIFSILPLKKLSTQSDYRITLKENRDIYKKELFSPKNKKINEFFNSFIRFKKNLDQVTQRLKHKTRHNKNSGFIKTLHDQPLFDIQEFGPRNALTTKLLINWDASNAKKWVSMYFKEIQYNAEANKIKLPEATTNAYMALIKAIKDKRLGKLTPLRAKEATWHPLKSDMQNKAIVA